MKLKDSVVVVRVNQMATKAITMAVNYFLSYMVNKARSSGVGLYICKRIIDRLGHSISILSEVEKDITIRY